MKKEQRSFIRSISQHWFLRNVFNPDVCLFIACQFALESAFGSSKLALCSHNLCGMKVPSKRYGKYNRYAPDCASKQVQLNEFASYQSDDDCIIDYVCWVLYFRPSVVNLSSVEHYASWIENRYCPEKDYVKNIVSLYNQFKDVV